MAYKGMDEVMRKLLSRTDVHKQLGVLIPGTVEFLVPVMHHGFISQIGLVTATSPNQGSGSFTCTIENNTKDINLVAGGVPVDLNGIAPAVMLDVPLDEANCMASEGDILKFTVDVTAGDATGGEDLQVVVEYHKAMTE